MAVDHQPCKAAAATSTLGRGTVDTQIAASPRCRLGSRFGRLGRSYVQRIVMAEPPLIVATTPAAAVRRTKAEIDATGHRSTIRWPHTSSEPTSVPLQIGLSSTHPCFRDRANFGFVV